LSRDAIVDAAVKILDVDGLDGLTIRRLGEELGSGAASIYWHVAGKQELAELVYDRILGEIDLPAIDPDRWREQIRSMARSGYQVMRSHRDAVRMSLGSIRLGPNGLRMIEWGLAVLRATGMPDHVALYFGDLLGRYIDASVLEEQGMMSDPNDPKLAAVAAYFQSLPIDRYPNIAATMGQWNAEGDVTNEGNLSRFELGLEILMRGLETYVPA